MCVPHSMVHYAIVWCSIVRFVMTYSFISYYPRWCYVIGYYIRVCGTIRCHKIVPHNIIWCNKKYTTKHQRAESFDETGPRPRGPWAHGLRAPIIISTSQPKPFSLAVKPPGVVQLTRPWNLVLKLSMHIVRLQGRACAVTSNMCFWKFSNEQLYILFDRTEDLLDIAQA